MHGIRKDEDIVQIKVNCGHYPIPFFPGYSRIRPPAQNEEENAKEYELSQKQRALERKLRNEKRDLAVLKAQNAPKELIDAQKERVRAANLKLDDFSSETGRARRRSREYTPIKPTFPVKSTFNPQTFDTTQKQEIQQFFRGQNVASQVTQTIANAVTMKYGKPFDDTGYKSPQKKQIADAKETLTNAPEDARGVWSKVADQLHQPIIDHKAEGAFYRPATQNTHFSTWAKCFEESNYQRKNTVFFHEYGHNIDNLLGIAKTGKRFENFSTTYVGKNGKTFGQVLEQEISKNIGAYYLRQNGYKDAYEAVKAAQNSKGGMGFGSFIRQALRGTLPYNEYKAISTTLINAGDDDSVLRPIVEKWLQPLIEHEFTNSVLRTDTRAAESFCNWARDRFTIYERADVSDIYGNFMARKIGKDFSYPFDIGHKYRYQLDSSNMPIEAFAEMFSAVVTQSDSLIGIKAMLPESYEFFLEMLRSAAND